MTLAGGLSVYLTMGQNGNVYEWQESAFDGANSSSSEDRAIRGGRWNTFEANLRIRDTNGPSLSESGLGFRVASIPEPSSAMLMVGSGLFGLVRRRRASAL